MIWWFILGGTVASGLWKLAHWHRHPCDFWEQGACEPWND